jgi:hypothetical protein
MPPPALKLGLAREYRKLQPGVKLLSVRRFDAISIFSTSESQALTHDCVDRPWFADLWWGRFL